MKHKNKIQIAGLGLALALSQAVSAYAAGTVVVGKAPGETAADHRGGSHNESGTGEHDDSHNESCPRGFGYPGPRSHGGKPRSLQQPDSGTAAIYCGSRQHAVNGFRGSHQSAGGCGRGRCTVKRGNR